MKKGIRQKRICRWCLDQVKENFSGERFMGYYKTCGKEVCLQAAYKDKNIRQLKRFHEQRICQYCQNSYEATSPTQRWCKTCSPNRASSTILQRYGVSKPAWDLMYKAQNGKCILCDEEPKVVDHDHKTGNVRSLLCYGCNTLIGLLERDSDWIVRALTYTKNHAVEI